MEYIGTFITVGVLVLIWAVCSAAWIVYRLRRYEAETKKPQVVGQPRKVHLGLGTYGGMTAGVAATALVYHEHQKRHDARQVQTTAFLQGLADERAQWEAEAMRRQQRGW